MRKGENAAAGRSGQCPRRVLARLSENGEVELQCDHTQRREQECMLGDGLPLQAIDDGLPVQAAQCATT